LARASEHTGGEAGLDDVDLQPLELPRDAQLLVARHRGAGALLAVAQRGVEDDEFVSHGRAFAGLRGARSLGNGEKTNGPLLYAGGPLIAGSGAVVVGDARVRSGQPQRGA
jgi:hypothetical protein